MEWCQVICKCKWNFNSDYNTSKNAHPLDPKKNILLPVHYLSIKLMSYALQILLLKQWNGKGKSKRLSSSPIFLKSEVQFLPLNNLLKSLMGVTFKWSSNHNITLIYCISVLLNHKEWVYVTFERFKQTFTPTRYRTTNHSIICRLHHSIYKTHKQWFQKVKEKIVMMDRLHLRM